MCSNCDSPGGCGCLPDEWSCWGPKGRIARIAITTQKATRPPIQARRMIQLSAARLIPANKGNEEEIMTFPEIKLTYAD